jgi:hypothetical protein
LQRCVCQEFKKSATEQFVQTSVSIQNVIDIIYIIIMYMCAGSAAVVAASPGKIAGKSCSNEQSERDYTLPAVSQKIA